MTHLSVLAEKAESLDERHSEVQRELETTSQQIATLGRKISDRSRNSKNKACRVDKLETGFEELRSELASTLRQIQGLTKCVEEFIAGRTSDLPAA